MNSYILEADAITGPWKIITYMKDFGEQSYFLNFPSKFISDNFFAGNIANQATVTVSSTAPNHSIDGLTDGNVAGYPKSGFTDWAGGRNCRRRSGSPFQS
jgi:hypothetical protein